jgi:hypothetical protein
LTRSEFWKAIVGGAAVASTMERTQPDVTPKSHARSPIVVAALVADDANMKAFADRLYEIQRNHATTYEHS